MSDLHNSTVLYCMNCHLNLFDNYIHSHQSKQSSPQLLPKQVNIDKLENKKTQWFWSEKNLYSLQTNVANLKKELTTALSIFLTFSVSVFIFKFFSTNNKHKNWSCFFFVGNGCCSFSYGALLLKVTQLSIFVLEMFAVGLVAKCGFSSSQSHVWVTTKAISCIFAHSSLLSSHTAKISNTFVIVEECIASKAPATWSSTSVLSPSLFPSQ